MKKIIVLFTMVLALVLCYGQARTSSIRTATPSNSNRTMTPPRHNTPMGATRTMSSSRQQSPQMRGTTTTRTRTNAVRTPSTSGSGHRVDARPQEGRNTHQNPNMAYYGHHSTHSGVNHSHYHHTYHHPHHHHDVHLHLCYWNPYVPIVCYYGMWEYGHLYYHPTYIERYDHINYINDTYHIEIVDFVSDDRYMYTIQQVDGYRYFRVFTQDNQLVAQYKLNRRYKTLVYDDTNNGVWAMTRNEKHSMLFIYNGENLVCYEE